MEPNPARGPQHAAGVHHGTDGNPRASTHPGSLEDNHSRGEVAPLLDLTSSDPDLGRDDALVADAH